MLCCFLILSLWCISQLRPCGPPRQTCRGLGFPTAAWRGLNGYFITKTSLLLFNIWETAFNLWKQVLLRRLFTYGYHDNMREQQLRLEKRFVQPWLHFVAKNNVYIAMAIFHIMFNLWERCISFMKKRPYYKVVYIWLPWLRARATHKGNEQGHKTEYTLLCTVWVKNV